MISHSRDRAQVQASAQSRALVTYGLRLPEQPPDMSDWTCKHCQNSNYWQRTRCACSCVCVHTHTLTHTLEYQRGACLRIVRATVFCTWPKHTSLRLCFDTLSWPGYMRSCGMPRFEAGGAPAASAPAYGSDVARYWSASAPAQSHAPRGTYSDTNKPIPPPRTDLRPWSRSPECTKPIDEAAVMTLVLQRDEMRRNRQFREADVV